MSLLPTDGAVDPRTDLTQAAIPTGASYSNFDSLRNCVVHWFSDCVLVAGGSQRTDTIVAASNAPGPQHRQHSGPPAAPVDPSFSFVLVVSDSCLYVFDRTAVVIRCIPIASMARLIVLDLVARDAKTADAVRQNALRHRQLHGGAADSALHAAHQLLGSTNQTAALIRSGAVPCFSLLGVSLTTSPGATATREHDLLIGVPLGAVEDLCGILLRIHWAHLGPNTKLPVEAVDLTPVRMNASRQQTQKTPLPNGGGVNTDSDSGIVVPSVADIFRGIDDAAVPPLFGLETSRSAHWELRVEPLRRWAQLEELLSKKHAMLVEEEVAIEAAFRRLKASLTEHAVVEQRDRWRQLAGQNQKLTDTVKLLEAEVKASRKLLDQEVPGGLEILKNMISGTGGSSGGLGLSAMESISGNALFDADTTSGTIDPYFMSPIAASSAHHQRSMIAQPSSASLLSRATSSRIAAGMHGTPGRCARCKELEFLVESHPNVDKVRILKAEEALVQLQRKLNDAESQVMPLRQENAELRNVISKMMRELVHASETEAKLRRKQSNAALMMAANSQGDEDAAARALHSKSFEVGVRNAIRTGEPYYRIEAPDSSTSTALPTLGDEVRQWRLLCSEMDRRHRQELRDLCNAFTMYDEIMSQSIHEALRNYEPTANVGLAQATGNILSVAKTRARQAKADATRAKKGQPIDHHAASPAAEGSKGDDNFQSHYRLGTPESTQGFVANSTSPVPYRDPNEVVRSQWSSSTPGRGHYPSTTPQPLQQQQQQQHRYLTTTSPGPLDSMVRWAEI